LFPQSPYYRLIYIPALTLNTGPYFSPISQNFTNIYLAFNTEKIIINMKQTLGYVIYYIVCGAVAVVVLLLVNT
jgi:hypothetical protein